VELRERLTLRVAAFFSRKLESVLLVSLLVVVELFVESDDSEIDRDGCCLLSMVKAFFELSSSFKVFNCTLLPLNFLAASSEASAAVIFGTLSFCNA
jgi:hypothetical protein